MKKIASLLLLCAMFSCKKDSPENANETVSLQPANNQMEWHFWGNAAQNQSGHATQLDAGTWSVGGETVYVRGAVKFDLSAIPASATIASATLSLYSTPNPLEGNLITANSGTNNSFFVRRITNTWTTSVSPAWNNQPTTTTEGQVSVAHTSLASFDVVDLDVTALVKTMHASNNYGFMIQLQNEVPSNIRQFASSAHANASKHPKLVVTY